MSSTRKDNFQDINRMHDEKGVLNRRRRLFPIYSETFAIDLVLENIFKHLGHADLKSCRDVKNCQWLRNSMKAWWSQTKVVFVEKDGECDKLIDYFRQIEINTYVTNYKFQHFKGDFKGFWERFAHSLKYLELVDCSFKSIDDFRHLIYSQCPNLRKLIAEEINVNSSDVVEPLEWQEPQFRSHKKLQFLKIQFSGTSKPISWMEMLSHFPNLKALETSANADLLRTISIIRGHDSKMLNLSHIDLQNTSRSDYDESIRYILLDSTLSFEVIRLGVGCCQPSTVVSILDLHAKSLKELRIVGKSTRSSSPNHNQILPREPLLKLEKLSIIGCPIVADIFKYTPNLYKVHLNYDGSCNTLKRANSNVRIERCKEIKLNVCVGWDETPDSDFVFFLNAFPNVERLEVSGLNNQKFTKICERWTKLVSFTIPFHSEVCDFGLLGYWGNDTNTVKDGARPNIRNLKSLQVFSMGSKQSRGKRLAAREAVGIEMKRGEIVIDVLKTLPHLKMFELKYYKLDPERIWEKIFAKYSGHSRVTEDGCKKPKSIQICKSGNRFGVRKEFIREGQEKK